MTMFILVIFLKTGYAGGVVTIPYADQASCEAASNLIPRASLITGFCIPGGLRSP